MRVYSDKENLRLLYFWIMLILCMALFACQNNSSPLPDELTEIQHLGVFEKHSVQVSVFLEADSTDQVYVAAKFEPTRPSFHLYSKDLPENGINGAGRPTRLELIVEPNVQSESELFADEPVLNFEIDGFNEPFPIYPDGPVTLRRLISPDYWEDDGMLTVSLTYMACSSNGQCLPPVVGEELSFKVDSNQWIGHD